MKFIRETSPYIRKNVSVKRMMIDVLIALTPIVIFAIYQNGWNGVKVIAISIITMLFFEFLVVMIKTWPKGMEFNSLFSTEGFLKVKANFTINNITAPLISALIYSLILPSATSGYIVFIGAFVGIFIAKMVFGGLGSNIFNPAAVGRMFVGVCFGTSIADAYLQGGVDVRTGGTPLNQIATSITSGFSNLNNIPDALSKYTFLDLFLGNIPGCMGEVSALLIIIAGIYLFVRHSADFRTALSMILSFTLIMLVVGIVGYNKMDLDIKDFVLYELLSGGILFGAVFMVTDPVTSPITKFGRIVFGSLVGVLAAFIRLFGAYPEGVAFSILIMNMFAPTIDYLSRGSIGYNWKQACGWILVMIILCAIAGFGVAGGM